MSNVARTLYLYVAGLFLVGVVVEFFLAGLAVFGLQSDATDAGTTLTDASFVSRFDPHLILGDIMFGVSLVLILVALAARLDRRAILTTVGLFALMSIQATRHSASRSSERRRISSCRRGRWRGARRRPRAAGWPAVQVP